MTDTFYETHLINVPLDLFSPARKEEEYGSLDNRKRKQTVLLSVLICHASAPTVMKLLLKRNKDFSIFGLVHTVTELGVCSLGWAAM